MNILTFDIEEWYIGKEMSTIGKESYLVRLNNLLGKLLDDLDEYHLTATFFCLGIIARMYPGVIRTIMSIGHEIGCHSDKHEWLTGFTHVEFEHDTRVAIDSIEQVIGVKIKSYRAPAFSIGESNKWALGILARNGIERDASIFPARRDFGGFPAFEYQVPMIIDHDGWKIKEFPVGMTKILGRNVAYSGGGYFRLFPYPAIKALASMNDYVMTYFHLHDFDKEQKRQLGSRYFKSYYGINRAYDKFRRFISDFEFVNLEEAERLVDWDSTLVVKL
jgi:polysaccharide deacetylase family protein (PEP-CTERM system associated)